MTFGNKPLALSMAECPPCPLHGPSTSMPRQWGTLDVDLRSLTRQQTVYMLDVYMWWPYPDLVISELFISAIVSVQPQPLQMSRLVNSIDGFRRKLSKIYWREASFNARHHPHGLDLTLLDNDSEFTEEMGSSVCGVTQANGMLMSPSYAGWHSVASWFRGDYPMDIVRNCMPLLVIWMLSDIAVRYCVRLSCSALTRTTSFSNTTMPSRPCMQRIYGWENVRVLDWPAHSPDLTPTEHIWDVLDQAVHHWHPFPANNDQLIKALQEAWETSHKWQLTNWWCLWGEYVPWYVRQMEDIIDTDFVTLTLEPSSSNSLRFWWSLHS